MATLAVGSSATVNISPGQSIAFVSSFGTNFRYTFSPYNPEVASPQNSSRSYGPAAQTLSAGPFVVTGLMTIYNDAGSTLTYNSTYANTDMGPLTVYGGVNLIPASANVTISPTGTGTVTINPATMGTMNAVQIGNLSRAPGYFSYWGVNHLDSSGTPGNVTNGNPKGRVAIAAGSNNVVVTNSLVLATSTVFAVINQASADATLTQVVRVVPAAGSFTIYGNANATAATVIDYLVIQA